MPVDPILDAWLVNATDDTARRPDTGRQPPTDPDGPYETHLLTAQAPDGGGFQVDPAVVAPIAAVARGLAGELRGSIARMVPESTDDQRALPDWQTPGAVATLGAEWYEALAQIAVDFEAFATDLDGVTENYTSAEGVNTTAMQGR